MNVIRTARLLKSGLRRVLLIAGFLVTACSNGSNETDQSSSRGPGDEGTELHDAVKRPLDKAREVEQIIVDKAAHDRAQIDGEH